MFPAAPTDSSYNSPDQEPYDPLRSCESPPGYSYDYDEYDSDGSRSSASHGSSSSRGSRTHVPKRPPPPKNTKFLYPKTEFVEELRPEELRWFYKDQQNKNWKPFIGYDSLRIECKYRELRHRDSHINEENVELIVVRGGLYEVDVVSRKCYAIYWSVESVEIMRGTWFYHGTWQPIDEAYARQIETEHLAKFQGQRITEEPKPGTVKESRKVVHNIKFKEFHVDWNSANEVYVFSESTSSRLYRSVSQRLGMQKSGTMIERGYAYESRMDDKPADIAHLVFVVHGIGQKMDTGRIVRCCSDLRNAVGRIKSKHFQDDSQEERAEFLPVEWRSSLKLDGDIVDSITPNKVKGLRLLLNSSAMDILYYTSPLYRSEITHGLQTQLNKLYARFKLRHPMFEAGGGKVSIIGHSLGCVITYDIITGWNPIELYDQYVTTAIEEVAHEVEGAAHLVSRLEKKRREVHDLEMTLLSLTEKQQIKTPTLKFKLENFFCLGSPLAVFLALRGVRPQATGLHDHIMPRGLCKRMFNIYHPADPVAYRIEPLVLKHYSGIAPLKVNRSDVASATPYVDMKPQAISALKASTSMDGKESLSSSRKSEKEKLEDIDEQIHQEVSKTDSSAQSQGFVGSFFSKLGRKKEKTEELSAELKAIRRVQKAMKHAQEEQERKDREKLTLQEQEEIEHTDLEYRLDYSLREGSMENSYVAAITSHTSYWTNTDVAMFVLSHLVPQKTSGKQETANGGEAQM